MRPEDLARLAALEELHTEKAVSLAANWPGDEADAFHHAGIALALREARQLAARSTMACGLVVDAHKRLPQSASFVPVSARLVEAAWLLGKGHTR